MSTRHVIHSSVIAASLALCACNAPPITTPVPMNDTWAGSSFQLTLKQKADILFMVDNSGSMDAMQKELRDRFDQFFAPFEKLAESGTYADLHIGVVTSDYGAGHGNHNGGCDASPGGQRGALQAIGRAAATSCKRPVGTNFISFKFGDGGAAASSNLPDGQNLLETFTCMASVGSGGCGYEHQLESVYAALHDPPVENEGFLRPDALLVIVFLTNEDDASAPPDTDIFDPGLVSVYGENDSFARQTRHAIVCCPPGAASCGDDELQFPPYGPSNGPLAGCRPAPNLPTGAGPGKQYDVSRYVDFFTKPAAQGGVKDDPRDVVLVGIDAPEEPFEVILSDPGTPTTMNYAPCPAIDEMHNPACTPVLAHSCFSTTHTGFFGDPAVRINSVIRAAANHAISSICDDDYSNALSAAANLIISNIGGLCIRQPLPRDADDPSKLHIDCVVDEVTDPGDGTESRQTLPECDGNTPGTPDSPCWRIEPKSTCNGLSPDGVGLTIDRGTGTAPPHTSAELRCATAG